MSFYMYNSIYMCMKISKSKLVHMIRESISRVLLKEYGGEQLVLPYDGDTRAYNYMQYVDFIKSLTKPGEITSNIDSYDDYYRQMNVNDETLFEIGRYVQFYDGFCRDEFNQEEYDYFIEQLVDTYGEDIIGDSEKQLWRKYDNGDGCGSELTDYGFECYMRELIESGGQSLRNMLSELFYNSEHGMVYINRELTIPNMWGRFNNVGGNDNRFEKGYNSLYELLQNEYGDLGYYWAYGKDKGSAYCGSYFKEGTSTVSLLAMTPIENIDIPETCAMENAGEYEISIKDNSLIMLVGVNIDGKEINIGHRVYK